MKKGKYEVLISCPKHLVEVDAYEFCIFGYCEFIVHKDPVYQNGWNVSDPRTGLAIVTNCKTKAKAIEEATARLYEKATQDELEARIAKVIGEIPAELIPRYYKENYGEKEV